MEIVKKSPVFSCCGFFVFVLVCFCFHEHGVETKKVDKTLSVYSDWEFLERFCFLSRDSDKGEGRMGYELRYPKSYGVEQLLFYYDVPGQWESVYDRGKTCQQKFDALGQSNYFDLDSSLCRQTVEDNEEWYECKGTMRFTSSRERWWYLVVSRCGNALDVSKNGRMYLEYKLHMTNGDGFLHKEYSADQFYIVVMNIVYFALYIKIVVLSSIVAYKLKHRQLLHRTFKMYMVAVTLWLSSLLCGVVAWSSYGNTGWELSSLEVFGRILQAASNIVFILILVLIAKGYTIVLGKLSNKSALKIVVFITLYSLATIILFIWEAKIFDPAVVLYYYESPPGYGLVVIILFGWLWFTKAVVFTMKHHKSKCKFYIIFYVLYTVWFWATPVTILLAMFSMAKWTREKTVVGVHLFIAYVGHMIFFVLTLPSLVNSTFSFHVKTSQISVMRREEDEDPGVYAVSDPDQWNGTGPNLDIFITAKGAEGSGGDGDRMYPMLDRQAPGMGVLSDSPPPSYPQALSCPQPVPAIGAQQVGGNTSTALEPSAPDAFHPSPPPLYEDFLNYNTRDASTRSQTLPPLRGTGLPPVLLQTDEAASSNIADDQNCLVASDASDKGDQNWPSDSGRTDVSKLFQVENH